MRRGSGTFVSFFVCLERGPSMGSVSLVRVKGGVPFMGSQFPTPWTWLCISPSPAKKWGILGHVLGSVTPTLRQWSTALTGYQPVLSDKVSDILLFLVLLLLLVISLFDSGDKSSSDSLSPPFGFPSQPEKLALQAERGPGWLMTGSYMTSHWPPVIFIATETGWTRTLSKKIHLLFACKLWRTKVFPFLSSHNIVSGLNISIN